MQRKQTSWREDIVRFFHDSPFSPTFVKQFSKRQAVAAFPHETAVYLPFLYSTYDTDGRNALHTAIRLGDTEYASIVLRACPELAFVPDLEFGLMPSEHSSDPRMLELLRTSSKQYRDSLSAWWHPRHAYPPRLKHVVAEVNAYVATSSPDYGVGRVVDMVCDILHQETGVLPPSGAIDMFMYTVRRGIEHPGISPHFSAGKCNKPANWAKMAVQMYRGWEYLECLLPGSQSLTTRTIVTLHQILTDSAVTGVCLGAFRDREVKKAMDIIVEKFRTGASKRHPVELSILLLYRVAEARPFLDYNGRVCRLLFAHALRRFGFPFAVSLSPKKEYTAAKNCLPALYMRAWESVSRATHRPDAF